MRSRPCAAALAATALAACATGSAATDGERGGRLGVRLENDLYARGGDLDSDYTQGLRVDYAEPAGSARSHPRDLLAPLAVLDLARLDRAPPEGVLAAEETGWFGEQRLYTPADFDLPQPMPDDRPFVAWLRFGVARTLAWLDADAGRRRDRYSRLELSLGWTGPPALGEQAQSLAHAVLDQPDPEGWQNQVGFEPTLQLDWSHRRRDLHVPLGDAAALDGTWGGGWQLGNFWTNANAEAVLRLGWHLPRALAPESWRSASGAPAWSLFVYAGAGGRAVLRDLSVEGGTFDDGTDLHAEPLVGVLEAGVAYRRGGFWLGYGFTAQTREYAEQDRPHEYGSIRLGYVWVP